MFDTIAIWFRVWAARRRAKKKAKVALKKLMLYGEMPYQELTVESLENIVSEISEIVRELDIGSTLVFRRRDGTEWRADIPRLGLGDNKKKGAGPPGR